MPALRSGDEGGLRPVRVCGVCVQCARACARVQCEHVCSVFVCACVQCACAYVQCVCECTVQCMRVCAVCSCMCVHCVQCVYACVQCVCMHVCVCVCPCARARVCVCSRRHVCRETSEGWAATAGRSSVERNRMCGLRKGISRTGEPAHEACREGRGGHAASAGEDGGPGGWGSTHKTQLTATACSRGRAGCPWGRGQGAPHRNPSESGGVVGMVAPPRIPSDG